MEGLDHGFGLVPEPTGSSRLDRDWTSFCTSFGAADGMHRDGPALAVALARRPDCADAAGRLFLQVSGASGSDPAAAPLMAVLAAMVAAMPAGMLQRVLAGMEVLDRQDFIRSAAAQFPPAGLLALCVAAGGAFDRPLSAPLLRLLQKLRGDAETLPQPLRARAEASFRELVVRMVQTWASATVNSGASGFDALFQDQQQPEKVTSRVSPEPLRVVQLALESGAIGNVVWGAMAVQTQSEKGMREMFDMLKRAPKSGAAVSAIAAHLATPARLAALLQEEPLDMAAVDVLVRQMGPSAARPLIEQLIEAKSRSTRRDIMDRLVRLGPDIEPYVLERLDDSRWYVIRNMVALLREAGCSLAHVPLHSFREHADPRVRRETLQLQLESAGMRDRALVEALADTDRHVLRTALQAARSQLPPAAIPILARRVTGSDFPPEFRVITLLLLGRTSSPAALEALLAFVQGGTTFFGKPKLAAKSPEMLAALGGLARSFRYDRRVAALLDVARASRDEQIINALKAAPGGAA
jgi:hypothetical protein